MTLEQWEMARIQCWSMTYAALVSDLPDRDCGYGADSAVAEWEKRFPKPPEQIAHGLVNTCLNCAAPMTTNGLRDKYCSERCRNTAQTRRYRNKLKSKPEYEPIAT